MIDQKNETEAPEKMTEPLPPHPSLKEFYDDDDARPTFIKGLFDASAPHYDRISSLMSLGTDKFYRRRVLLESGLAPGMRMLDVACGTGMVAGPASEIVGPGGFVIGLDPSPGMLQEALERERVTWAVLGKGEELPMADGTFDFLAMGFALRHVADLKEAFGEYKRVLKPGGTVLILEITPPSSKLSYQFFRFYLKYVIPKLTRFTTFSRDAEQLMSYFWDTVEFCVPAETILEALQQSGFINVKRRVQAGMFSEYRATKT